MGKLGFHVSTRAVLIYVALLTTLLLFPPSMAQEKEKLTDLQLVDIDGNVFKLNDLIGKGKPVLIDYMATWCKPCEQMMPILLNVRRSFGNSIVIISISIDPVRDDLEKLRRFRARFQADWVFAMPLVKQETLNKTINVGGFKIPEVMFDIITSHKILVIPTTTIVNTQGYVVSRHYGGFPLVNEEVLYNALVKAGAQKPGLITTDWLFIIFAAAGSLAAILISLGILNRMLRRK
jgi:thiol-disulfide isomerase/thioredoxin